MSNHYYKDIAIVLAGAFQAARLVKNIANNKRYDSEAFIGSVQSIFKIDANSVIDVYEDLKHIQLGLRELISFFDLQHNKRDPEIARYVYSMFYLERQLNRKPEVLKKIKTGIELAERQSQHFSKTHPNVILNLADTYQKTLSQFKFRIQITSEQPFPNQSNLLAEIRVLLLAGIRAAVLWRQIGGSRWQLLFFYKRLKKAARELLNESL